MFSERTIIYFTPFFFKNGNPSKNKYFVVLKNIGNKSIIASLPTSKDYVPEELEIEHGCIECESKKFNCFVFSPSVEITECGKSFERPTYLYGYLLDEYEISKMKEIYTEKKDFEIWGVMKTEVFSKLIECFKSSGVVKRKYKRLL